MAQQNRPYGLRTLALDVAVLVLFWLLGFALVEAAQRVTDAWAVRDIGHLIGEVVSLGLAVRLRARIAAFLTAGFAAFTLAEITIHLLLGIRAAQGGPTHFAVMGAALIGVSLGALVLKRVQRGTNAQAA